MTDIIQMYPLGRFGNQMFEYAFLKRYSNTMGYELQVPDKCALREMFDIPDPFPTKMLPIVNEGYFEWGMKNVMVKDYFQRSQYTLHYDREYCRKILKFKPDILARDNGSFYLVAHHRVGDFKRHKDIFCIVSRESYNKAMKQYGYLPDSAFWVSDNRHKSFIDDFMIMVNAKVLFRANSSYSLWAHVLSKDNEQKCYSPIIKGVGDMDCEFTEGGDQPIVYGQDFFRFAK